MTMVPNEKGELVPMRPVIRLVYMYGLSKLECVDLKGSFSNALYGSDA